MYRVIQGAIAGYDKVYVYGRLLKRNVEHMKAVAL